MTVKGWNAIDPSRLGLILSFVAVAENLSFVGAAKGIGTTTSTISRNVARLEDLLGVRLIERTTRQVSLTEAGRLYHEKCVDILTSLSHADELVSTYGAQPHGKLRISVPVAFGRLYLASIVARFVTEHPGISIETNFSDRFVDIVAERYDLALRIGTLPSSGLIARKVAVNHRVPVASRSYLAENGVPESPVDLGAHNCLRYTSYPFSGGTWQFAHGSETKSVQISGNFVTDNSEAVYEAALAGAGIGLVPYYIAWQALRDGRLVRLLPEWSAEPTAGIYFVYPSARFLAPKTKLFVDYALEAIRGAEWRNES